MRHRVRLEDADLQHLQARGRRGSSDQPALVSDHDHARRVGLRDVKHPDQPGELDLRADLFKALADGCDRGVLVIVDESAGQAPEPVAGLDRAATQDDSPLRFHDHGGRHLRVVPQDEAVMRASLDLTTFDDSRHQPGAAVDAEMPHV
jgi:hypothetical protein